MTVVGIEVYKERTLDYLEYLASKTERLGRGTGVNGGAFLGRGTGYSDIGSRRGDFSYRNTPRKAVIQ